MTQVAMANRSNMGEVAIKTVKSISTSRFDISLVQVPSGGFRVVYASHGGEVQMSEPVFDYKMAAYMFDIKLQELEGH